MERLYRKMFDQVRMSEEQARRVRTSLASRCSQIEMEAIPMKQAKYVRRPIMAVAIVVLVCALSVTAFAASGGFGKVYQLMSGGVQQDVLDENGNVIGVEGSVDLDKVEPPVELREDGRLYLVVNGENQDITDQCSYTEPYIYECTGEDGLRHAFVVGGDLDAIGWAEFMWDEDGLPAAGAASFGTSAGTSDAPWLDAGKDALNLPW